MAFNLSRSGVRWMIILSTFFNYVLLSAQPNLYGVLTKSGPNNAGTLFKYDGTTQTLEVKYAFMDAEGSSPHGTLLFATDGMFYGTTNEGGSMGYGTLFQYNPQTEVLTTKFNFDYNNSGGYNYAQLVQLDNGEIVGVCSSGGVNGDGTIWKYNISTNQFTKLFDFTDQTGAFPYTGVLQATNGKLYGVTTNLGSGDGGTLYEFDPLTNSFSILQAFEYSIGAFGYAQLIEVNNKLIGVTYYGGSGDAGTIFEYDLNSTQFTTTHNFDYGLNGGMPYGGGLNFASNGLLYGTTSAGGQNGEGTLFSYNPATGDFNKLHDFNPLVGGPSYCPVVQASDGMLYGMTYQGNNNGVFDFGSLYKVDIASSVYSTVMIFDSSTGGKPLLTGLAETQTITPPNCSPSGINAGSITFSGSFNPNISNTVVSTAPATPVTGKASVEYIWLKSKVNVPNTVGNPHWSVVAGSQNQVELNLDQLVETTYFIRCSRLQGCTKYYGESNIVEVTVDKCLPDFIHGGEVSFNGVYNPNHPNIITNKVNATSDFGNIINVEYIWLSNDEDVPFNNGSNGWELIEGSSNPSYTISSLMETTYFIRCARVEGCTKYYGESNIVKVTVDKCLPDFIHGGKISFNGVYNPNHPNIITNKVNATSDFGNNINVEYIWLSNDEDVPFNNGSNGWELIEGSSNPFYTIGELDETTYFIRCARVEECETYWGESNIVEVIYENPCDPADIVGGSIAFVKATSHKDSNKIISEEDAYNSTDDSLPIEYVWYYNSKNLPFENGNGWSVNKGSVNASLTRGKIAKGQNYFIRLARVVGCKKYSGPSNIVEVGDPCDPDDLLPGSIEATKTSVPQGRLILIESEEDAKLVHVHDKLHYQWAVSTTSDDTDDIINNADWTILPNEALSTLEIVINESINIVRIVNRSQCTDLVVPSNVVRVEVSDENGGRKSNYDVYPTPVASGQCITLKFMNKDDDKVDIKIMNMSGSQSIFDSYSLSNGLNTIPIRSDQLTPGIYLLEIRRGKESEIRRFMIR